MNLKFRLKLKLCQINIKISETRWEERKNLFLSARLLSHPQQTRQIRNNLCCVVHTTASQLSFQRVYEEHGKLEAYFSLKAFKG